MPVLMFMLVEPPQGASLNLDFVQIGTAYFMVDSRAVPG